MFHPLAPQEEVSQQQKSPALPSSARPQLPQRQSLEAQFLQHRLQVGPSPLLLRLCARPESAFLCSRSLLCLVWASWAFIFRVAA